MLGTGVQGGPVCHLRGTTAAERKWGRSEGPSQGVRPPGPGGHWSGVTRTQKPEELDLPKRHWGVRCAPPPDAENPRLRRQLPVPGASPQGWGQRTSRYLFRPAVLHTLLSILNNCHISKPSSVGNVAGRTGETPQRHVFKRSRHVCLLRFASSSRSCFSLSVTEIINRDEFTCV